jgi:hypothetical protein
MKPMSNVDLRTCTDEALLRECRVQAFRGSGPGGQHRNKTSTAVRIVHEPSGVTAMASESRSQDRNREEAIRRLRHRLALTQRELIDSEKFEPPEWFKALAAARLVLGRKRAEYLPVMGLVVDVLARSGWSVSEAARLLGISTGTLSRFLKGDEKLFGYVNERRAEMGLKPLGRD